jgi:hypothetical protein
MMRTSLSPGQLHLRRDGKTIAESQRTLFDMSETSLFNGTIWQGKEGLNSVPANVTWGHSVKLLQPC